MIFTGLFLTSLIAAAASIPAGVYIGKNGEVGASWGGYSASAGLGGIVSGTGTRGGLHAEAGTPDGHFAAAGLGGSVSEGGNKGVIYSVAKKPTVSHAHASASAVSTSVASSGASSSSNAGSGGQVHVVTKPHVQHGPSFFDDIFNIPISVLGAVNKYLNNNVRKGVHVHGTTVVADGGHGHVTTTVVKPVSTVQSSASAVSSASSSASSSTNGNTNYVVSGNIDNNIYATPVKGGPTKYDDIFNIPVSVLGAVNRLLNNGKK